MIEKIIEHISGTLSINSKQVSATVALLNEGATIEIDHII